MKNKTKIILFASLIVVMILPFSNMELAEATSLDNTTKNVKTLEKTLKKSSNWTKELLKKSDYKSLDNDTKLQYLEFVQSMIDDKDPYQKSMMTLVEEYSEVTSKINDADSQQDISKEKNRKSMIIEELEELGIVSEKKFKDNPEYWSDKIRNAKESKGSYERVSGESEKTEYTLVHTGDVSIRREAIVTVLCIPGQSIGCPIGTIGWGPGMTSTWAVQLQTGNASWASYGCLQNDVQHTTVSWTQTGHHEKRWFWGSPITHTHNGNITTLGTNNYCHGWVDTSNVEAGNIIASDTVIGLSIILTGSHA